MVWQVDVGVVGFDVWQCVVVLFDCQCGDVYVGCVLFQVLGVYVLQCVVFIEDVVDQQYVMVEQCGGWFVFLDQVVVGGFIVVVGGMQVIELYVLVVGIQFQCKLFGEWQGVMYD